jgi:pyruvate/2-oxoglutarate dehydrogenase complex dihydrolipoamide dehydrogenase (E3) component
MAKMRKVTVVQGTASSRSAPPEGARMADGKTQTIRSSNAIIAAGSRP